MQVDEYIKKSKYSSEVKKGGINYLLDRWDSTCNGLPFNDRYQFDEYLNDLSTRDIIDEIIDNCSISQEFIEKISFIDTIFKEKTVLVEECLWGIRIETKLLYNNVKNWYFFRIPEERKVDWLP